MINIDKKEKCCGCYSCFNICPKNAIEMIEDNKGFMYPRVNIERCIDCKLCEKVCPIINKKQVVNNPTAYACYNKDERIRRDSSSGGIFNLLASYILKINGIVYGAAFNSDWKVEHIRVDSEEELYKLRTSKYMQSSIDETLKKAKSDLDKGIFVLFTGTPCQVNAFISFLNGKKYKNLYTQDIVCHGVPSPKVWKKYIEYRKKIDNDEPKHINFRQKDNGWSSYDLLIKYKNTEYKVNHKKDLFMKAFLRNVCLRDSCYNCQFKEKSRQTDITLADFWGINNVLPGFNDNKGTSLVIVNTEKGKELFSKIQNDMVFIETDFEKSIKYNKSMYESANKPQNREAFFENCSTMDFEELVENYTSKQNEINILKKIIRKIKSLV